VFTTAFALAQQTTSHNKDIHAMDISRNIFRVVINYSVPDDEGSGLILNYEHEIKRPFTFILKAGPTVHVGGSDAFGNDDKFTFNLLAAGELRYYFTLLHRIKKEKPVQNFSGLYLSLEQYILSNPVALINEERKDAYEGSTGAFLQVGYQKQLGKFYLNAYVGPRLYGNDFGRGDRSLNGFHGGIAIGIVF
jgi:hypothetical protein